MKTAVKGRQLKVTIDRGLAETSKGSCPSRGVSMASEIPRFIREASGTASPAIVPGRTSTRRSRRNAVAKIVGSLHSIAGAEEGYKENIPETLKAGQPMMQQRPQSMPLKKPFRFSKRLSLSQKWRAWHHPRRLGPFRFGGGV
jgi:hypothetical protein